MGISHVTLGTTNAIRGREDGSFLDDLTET